MSLPLTAARRIAFIQAGWHRDIVDQCRDSFLRTLGEHGFDESAVDLFTVPGAFEIPLRAKLLALTGDYAGIVGAGFVVNGGIYRHEFVAQAVISGLMQVQLETLTPVFSAVLTPHNFHECQEHSSFFQSHFVTKGREVALACISTVVSLSQAATVTEGVEHVAA
ncbi:6,7-dimethyl-8-ribityllumazine synthase [Burkholderia sp. SCN-KJ]|uniref:6,7-dimethyl-8-ribityllumazine synthase n=1 Tax=Burkholderia sp. SCN-KJ TaxID=2969248 RepID=UPI00214FC8AC|nr:6,7-dimethyl-8-ribityllumazine synthase [Burkholderia sp. SCN-KJ]MCR4466222.1 6,7-dimethyl-8-ribityllumazine synthase [Burkholderia sp. SCN-KJ]